MFTEPVAPPNHVDSDRLLHAATGLGEQILAEEAHQGRDLRQLAFGDLAELRGGCQLSRLPDVPAEIRRQGKLDPVNAAGSAEDIPEQFPWQPRQRPHLVQLHLRMVGLKGLGVRREGRHASVCHRRRHGEQRPAGARGALHAWAVAFTEDGMIDEYRGCTFVNAAAEYEPPDHPVRMMAVEHRRWVNATTETLLREYGHPDPVAATRVLMALRTGYVYSLGLEEDTGWAEQFLAAFCRVIEERWAGEPPRVRSG